MAAARVRVHAAFGVLAVGLCTLQATVDDGGRHTAVALATLVPLVVIMVQLVRRTAADRRAWWVLASGLGLLGVLDVTTLVGLHPPASITPDTAALLIGGYAALLTGGLLATIPVIRKDAGGLTDAMIVGLGAASVLWTAVVSAPLTTFGVDPVRRVYYLAIVLLVSAMLGAMARAFAVARHARASTLYVIVATASTYLGNIGEATTPPGSAARDWVVYCWIIAYLALAAGIAHPAVRSIAVDTSRVGSLTGRRLVFLGVALGLNPLLAGALELAGGRPDTLLLSVGTLAVTPLVLVRISILARMHASAEHRLRVLATHDELTGLPNRRAVTEHLDALLARVATDCSPGLAMLFLDLDDFKQVNDGHGHPMGDRLLVEVAQRLRSAVRATDLVGRFGGDEFILVLEGDPEDARAAGLGAVERALVEPVRLDTLVASTRASIGSAIARTGEVLTTDQLLSAADASMYEIKRTRRGSRMVTQRGPAAAPDAAALDGAAPTALV